MNFDKYVDRYERGRTPFDIREWYNHVTDIENKNDHDYDYDDEDEDEDEDDYDYSSWDLRGYQEIDSFLRRRVDSKAALAKSSLFKGETDFEIESEYLGDANNFINNLSERLNSKNWKLRDIVRDVPQIMINKPLLEPELRNVVEIIAVLMRSTTVVPLDNESHRGEISENFIPVLKKFQTNAIRSYYKDRYHAALLACLIATSIEYKAKENSYRGAKESYIPTAWANAFYTVAKDDRYADRCIHPLHHLWTVDVNRTQYNKIGDMLYETLDRVMKNQSSNMSLLYTEEDNLSESEKEERRLMMLQSFVKRLNSELYHTVLILAKPIITTYDTLSLERNDNTIDIATKNISTLLTNAHEMYINNSNIDETTVDGYIQWIKETYTALVNKVFNWFRISFNELNKTPEEQERFISVFKKMSWAEWSSSGYNFHGYSVIQASVIVRNSVISNRGVGLDINANFITPKTCPRQLTNSQLVEKYKKQLLQCKTFSSQLKTMISIIRKHASKDDIVVDTSWDNNWDNKDPEGYLSAVGLDRHFRNTSNGQKIEKEIAHGLSALGNSAIDDAVEDLSNIASYCNKDYFNMISDIGSRLFHYQTASQRETLQVTLRQEEILGASISGYGWSSCHSGEYSNTPLGLATNQVSFMIMSKGTRPQPILGVSSKKKRAYGHYAESATNPDDFIIAIEHFYPDKNSSASRNVLKALLARKGMTMDDVVRVDGNLFGRAEYMIAENGEGIHGYYDYYMAPTPNYISKSLYKKIMPLVDDFTDQRIERGEELVDYFNEIEDNPTVVEMMKKFNDLDDDNKRAFYIKHGLINFIFGDDLVDDDLERFLDDDLRLDDPNMLTTYAHFRGFREVGIEVDTIVAQEVPSLGYVDNEIYGDYNTYQSYDFMTSGWISSVDTEVCLQAYNA